MDEINVATIQSLYDWTASATSYGRKKNLNKKTIERISGFLGKIFRVAVDMKVIDESPIKKTLLKNNGERAGHHKAISKADMNTIKKGIPLLENERQRLYMTLIAYAGMRPEEALGLTWEHVFLDEGYCEIARTVTFPDKSKPTIRDCGKTEDSIRPIVLPNAAIQILKRVRNRQGYVVHGEEDDLPVSYSTFRRMSRGAFKALGMEGKCCSYDFRTTYGTELTENGFTTKQVADMMGHADTRMVETVYARRRHEGVMSHRDRLNQLNEAYAG